MSPSVPGGHAGSGRTGPPLAGTTTTITGDASTDTGDASTGTATESTADIALTHRDDRKSHPSDDYFALGRVLDIEIEIDKGDWDVLRHQRWTHDSLRDIYTWFSGTVTADGETHTNVGVRKKGFRGSHDPDRPSLKLRFDKYVNGQSLGGVIERMTLNNNKADYSRIKTCLTYQIFAAAGSPAPRCNLAAVTVNGEYLGLYSNVEPIKEPFLSLHFEDADGNLYEGGATMNTPSDFVPAYRFTLEKETNEDEDDWSDVDAVIEALLDSSDVGLEALGEIVDLDRFPPPFGRQKC